MITNEFAEASAEIIEILSYIPNEYIQKIPKKLRDFFNLVKSNNYILKIDPYKSLEEQELKQKTKTLLTIIYKNYWCNEKEKKVLDGILIENEKKYEEEIRQKYNPDDIFKNRNTKKIENETLLEINNMITIKEEKWYKKLFNIIKNLFNKK